MIFEKVKTLGRLCFNIKKKINIQGLPGRFFFFFFLKIGNCQWQRYWQQKNSCIRNCDTWKIWRYIPAKIHGLYLKFITWILHSSWNFYTAILYFICFIRFQHAYFIFVVQVLHSRLSLIHSKLHGVYFSFEFHITNSTTFNVNSANGIDLHASVTSKGLRKNRNPESGIRNLRPEILI